MLHPWSLGPGQVHLSPCSLAFHNIMFQQDSCPSFGIFWALRAWLSDQMMRWYTFLSMIKTLSSLKDCHHIMGNRVEWYLYLYLKNVTISWDSEWDASSAFRRNPMKRTIVLHSIYISCAQNNSTQHNTCQGQNEQDEKNMEDLIWLYDYDGSVLWFSFTSATSFVSSTTPICLFVCISSLPRSLTWERRQEFGKFDDIYFAATLLNVPTRHLSFLNIVQCASVAFINILCLCQHCGHVFVL